MKTLYRNLQTITLEELFGYINEIELGYIKVNYHPEDSNVVIFNYTEKATFEKRWNKYTMSARGLILDLTDVKDNGRIYILAKPFEKFPNFGSNEIIGYEDDIDFNEVETIMEKMDGSLGISYIFKNEIRFATRGSFTSEQAIKATEIWRNKYAHRFDMFRLESNPYTVMAEIIYPENRVVVDYEGQEDLVLLGIRFLHISGYRDEATLEELKQFAHLIHMPMAGIYADKTIDELLEMKKTISANEEGWIIKFKNGKRLKIKGEEYLQVHRIKHGMSTKAKYKAWADGSLNEYIMMLPEEFRPELEAFDAKLFVVLKIIINSIDSLYHSIKTDDRKEFALKVQAHAPKEFQKFLFKMYQTKQVPEIMIKQHIYDNYIEYNEAVELLWQKQDS